VHLQNTSQKHNS